MPQSAQYSRGWYTARHNRNDEASLVADADPEALAVTQG